MNETSVHRPPPHADDNGLRRAVYALLGAWLALVVIVSVGVGAVAGELLFPAWGDWALIVQVTVSLTLMGAACWFYEDAVAWLRGYIEGRAR